MKKVTYIFTLILFTSAGSGCTSSHSHPPLDTVNNVILTQYVGQWYTAARIPNKFEKNCLQSKAEYALNDDGTIAVINSCKTKDGKTESVTGRAWVVDPVTNAKLKVGFFSILGWYPQFALGDYWILALGPRNNKGEYSYALVGEPSRQYGWILSRTRQLLDEYREQAWQQFESRGYQRENFEVFE